MKNKNLIFFIVIGFIVTTALWGFVGGCGTLNMSLKSRQEPKDNAEEKKGVDGPILEGSQKEAAGSMQEGSSYIVEGGDTLWKISRKFSVSINDIKAINNLNTDSIFAGQRLVIPGYKEDIKEREPIEKKEAKKATQETVKKPEEKKELKVEEGAKTKVESSKEQEKVSPEKQSGAVAPAIQKSTKPGMAVYKAGQNDSLWRIAQMCGTTIEHIAELNGLKKDAKLKEGQEIFIPENE